VACSSSAGTGMPLLGTVRSGDGLASATGLRKGDGVFVVNWLIERSARQAGAGWERAERQAGARLGARELLEIVRREYRAVRTG
jgi:hypothetical protein